MENATKALLIAGAILIILAVLSLLVVFWNDVSIYFTANHEAKMLQQLIEFNNKFANYSGKEIRGNELVSIMNRIVDYNNFQSEMVGYEPIRITINLEGKNSEFLCGNESGGDYIIPSSGPITNNTDDTVIRDIATTSSRLVERFSDKIPGLTDVRLQKMSARYETIVYDEKYTGMNLDEYKNNRANLLTKILGYSVSADDELIEDAKKATYQYYQYTMFKRAVFKCTNVSYNQDNRKS